MFNAKLTARIVAAAALAGAGLGIGACGSHHTPPRQPSASCKQAVARQDKFTTSTISKWPAFADLASWPAGVPWTDTPGQLRIIEDTQYLNMSLVKNYCPATTYVRYINFTLPNS